MAVMWMATHLVDVVVEDEDAVPSTVASGVPMSLLRVAVGSVQSGGTSADGGVNAPWTGRCRAGVPVEEGAFLKASGRTWLVDLVDDNPNPVMDPGLVMSCREVTA